MCKGDDNDDDDDEVVFCFGMAAVVMEDDFLWTVKATEAGTAAKAKVKTSKDEMIFMVMMIAGTR